MSDLIAKGFLEQADVVGFAGMEVTVSLTKAPEQASVALMRVRLPDGHELIALGDGSVQQLPH